MQSFIGCKRGKVRNNADTADFSSVEKSFCVPFCVAGQGRDSSSPLLAAK